MFRHGRLAILAILVTPGSLLAQAFSYAPGTGQYRITSSMKGAQEVMGQRQDIEQSSNQLVTVLVERAAGDTLTVTSTLDSIAIVGPMGMTPPGLDKLSGTKVVARISPAGYVYSATGPSSDSVPSAAQITDELGYFLPRISGSLAAGATWTDTVSRSVRQGGLDVQRKVVATYTVMGDTTVNGQRASRIDRKASTEFTGSGEQQGQPMTLEGKSSGTGSLAVTPTGVLLGYVNEEQASITVVLAANNMEIGITQNATTRVEKVR